MMENIEGVKSQISESKVKKRHSVQNSLLYLFLNVKNSIKKKGDYFKRKITKYSYTTFLIIKIIYY